VGIVHRSLAIGCSSDDYFIFVSPKMDNWRINTRFSKGLMVLRKEKGDMQITCLLFLMRPAWAIAKQ
jgi:hypothetical protein